MLSAFRSKADADELINRHKVVIGEPPIDQDIFYSELDLIRRQGFDMRASNTASGVTNMSFPIFDSFGKVIAAVTCPYIGRIDTLDVPSIEQCKKAYSKLAKKLTQYYRGD